MAKTKQPADPTAILQGIREDLAGWRKESVQRDDGLRTELREWRLESVRRDDFVELNGLVEQMAADVRQLKAERTQEQADEFESRLKRIEEHLHLGS